MTLRPCPQFHKRNTTLRGPRRPPCDGIPSVTRSESPRGSHARNRGTSGHLGGHRSRCPNTPVKEEAWQNPLIQLANQRIRQTCRDMQDIRGNAAIRHHGCRRQGRRRRRHHRNRIIIIIIIVIMGFEVTRPTRRCPRHIAQRRLPHQTCIRPRQRWAAEGPPRPVGRRASARATTLRPWARSGWRRLSTEMTPGRWRTSPEESTKEACGRIWTCRGPKTGV